MSTFRYWLSKCINELAWWICPEPHKTNLQIIWQAKMGEFTKAAEMLAGKEK